MAFDAFRIGPGARVAGYLIEEQVGAGGMAVVFRARDERLGRLAALKIIAPALTADREFRLRFIRESRAAAQVDHPNIIPIYGSGETDDGVMFIAMRYIPDGDVRSLLGRMGPLSAEQVMSIIAPVADALDAAHAAGIVHRDVKPANMLLDRGGTHVYLTDFGLTMVKDDTGTTESGQFLGTPDYAAPEQVRGAQVDGRADQWALACTAFELLIGAPPFKGTDVMATMFAAMEAPAPAVTSRRPELPNAVDAVFERALAKDPAARYPSCGRFSEALGAALGLAAPPTGWLTASASSRPRFTARPIAPEAKPPEDEEEDPDEYQPDWLDIPLRESFRYVHEPSPASDDALPSLGNDELIAKLEKRLRHSRGGTFLITGFRGVGKSTLVMRAIDELGARGGSSDIVVPVSLSVARSTTTERLLFAVVRRIFETLSDERVLDRLPPQTRHALLVSYMRTSLSYKETQSKSTQQSAGLDVGLGPGKLVKAVANIAAPQVSMSASRSQSLATEAAFLAYSETDVEYDLMRIISLVNRTLDSPVSRRRWLRRLLPRWLQRHGLAAPPRLRLVIVLDEVDKLTVDEKGMAAVEELLSGIKNVLTMSGAHFLVVAGPDLQDRAARDAARGTGVYESVFGWRLYVPCVWDAPERLVRDVVINAKRQDKAKVDMLVDYLRFKARGVPRRLLQEVNSFVGWADDKPRLQIGRRDLDRVEFFARIEEILRNFMEGTDRIGLFPAAIDEDRLRLGSYFVVDWVLLSKGIPFTASELLREGEDSKFDPLLRLDKTSIDRLLDHLTAHGLLTTVRTGDAMNTLLPDVKDSAEKSYRLSDDIQRLLPKVGDRTEMRPLATLAYPRGGASAQPVVIGGRYELGDLISQGSLRTVYKGRDIVTGRQVAIKLLLPALTTDQIALARFRREAEITSHLDHAQLVRTYAILDGPADYAIITERLLGQTLQQQVHDEGPMQPGEVAGLGQVLADALMYLAGEQVVRLDLKPNNIVMADRGPVITDLGVALPQNPNTSALTAAGLLIGTPAFMAPELLKGRPADPRSDIYSLGLVLYYCLAGKLPWEDLPNIAAIINAVLTEGLDMSGLRISPALRMALEKATAADPAARFPDAAAFGSELRGTPEWQEFQVTP